MGRRIGSVKILDAATAVANGASHIALEPRRTFQGTGFTSSGAGSASIIVQVSNDNINFIDIGTITLTLSTTVSTDGFASDAAWRYVRGRVDAISGTGAQVDLWLGA